MSESVIDRATEVILKAQSQAMDAQVKLRPRPGEPEWHFGLRRREAYCRHFARELDSADLLRADAAERAPISLVGHHAYLQGREVAKQRYNFYALLQAAMRQADTNNATVLRNAYPEVWAELQERYNAPNGLIPGDTGYEAAI